jgi:hypothetical protein
LQAVEPVIECAQLTVVGIHFMAGGPMHLTSANAVSDANLQRKIAEISGAQKRRGVSSQRKGSSRQVFDRSFLRQF